MDLLPISALQHLLFCPRQCALIHLEREWSENRFTAEGRVLHERAHDGPDESRPGIHISRGMSVGSERLGISGQCDIVEFHRDGRIIPVEYKRGKPKAIRADEVQLCAQSLCLEDMIEGATLSVGYLFYGKPRRRQEVMIDEALRALTLETIARLQALICSGITPIATYEKEKCDACSLIDICQPKAMSGSGSGSRKSAQSRFLSLINSPS